MGLSNYNIDGDRVIDSHGVGSIDASTIIGVPSIGVFAPASADYIIQGKMLTTSITMSPYEAEQMDNIEIKNRLITLMVREIMDNKCIEFTKQQDYAKDEVIIRARIYVTPDTDVKLIRQVQK
jgi:hypothetical protein